MAFLWKVGMAVHTQVSLPLTEPTARTQDTLQHWLPFFHAGAGPVLTGTSHPSSCGPCPSLIPGLALRPSCWAPPIHPRLWRAQCRPGGQCQPHSPEIRCVLWRSVSSGPVQLPACWSGGPEAAGGHVGSTFSRRSRISEGSSSCHLGIGGGEH